MDKMFQKLAKRSKPSVDVALETQSPQAKSEPESWPKAPGQATDRLPPQPPRNPGKLVWLDRDPGSEGRRTSCGWYSCCRIVRNGVETFEVWTREPLTAGMKQLAIGLSTFRDGMKIAQEDNDRATGASS